MSEFDVAAFEERYRQLEVELGAFNVGQAVRVLAGLPLGAEGWDNVLQAEIRRCVDLYKLHYRGAEGPTTIRVGRNPLSVTTSHDELMATIGFVQGATFVVAALQEQGRLDRASS